MRFLLISVVLALQGFAQDASAPRPAYKQLRYDEDWSGLRTHDDWLDPFKRIPIGSGDDTYLSIGGQIRERYEFFDHGTWGRDSADSSSLLQRYMLHADLHIGPRFRVFGELKSGLEEYRKDGPRPPDEDRLDVHQAFVEMDLSHGASLRAGRQEVAFGSSRLISVREGPNVRQSFDGARLSLRAAGWLTDLFAFKPVETSVGAFDDSPDHTRSFWGVYGVHKLPIVPGGNIDLYYFGLDRKRARFDAGTGREQRHTAGARIWGRAEAWDYNTEILAQWGRFGAGDIRAWSVASDTGYRLDGMQWKPRFGLKADIASGDRNPGDRTLGTLNALFPKGAYFSEADLLGPYNLMDLHPSVELHVLKNVTITPDLDFFWRQSTRDGIYGISGNLLRSGATVGARYIGFHASAQVEWRIDRHTSFAATYLHFVPGEFLRRAPPDRGVNFIATTITYRF